MSRLNSLSGLRLSGLRLPGLYLSRVTADSPADLIESPPASSPPADSPPPSSAPPHLAAPSFLPGWDARIVVALITIGAVLTPILLDSSFWMTLFVTAGVYAAAAIGLNLLTGYTGQVSLGHASFLTIGGYAAAYFGASQGWPLLAWLALAALVGAAVGGIIGPFALRLKGDYLVVASLALLFITSHVVENWTSLTGGHNGTSTSKAPLDVGFGRYSLDFGELKIFGMEFTRNEGMFYLAWILVGLCAIVARNIVRSRPGRAMQAVRDRDTAAEALGVNSARYKIAAFVISSGMASAAGGLLAVSQRFLTPREPLAELIISIQFVAIIVVGGVATVFGAVIGAVLVTVVQEVIVEYTHWLDFNVPFLDRPLVSNQVLSDQIFNPGLFSSLLFGLLLLGFLLKWPGGVASWVRSLRLLVLRWAQRARATAGG